MLALRVAALALIVAVAFIRVGRTWSVFAATADEPQHIVAGVEWHARTDRVQHEPWRTVNPPLARIAVGLGPYLAGMQSTPWLRDALYTGPGYLRNLGLARPGILPFLALVIVLTWLHARRAYGEAAAWVAAVAVSCIPAILGHAGLATTDVAFTATFLLALLLLLRWIEEPTAARAALAGPGARAGGRDQVLGAGVAPDRVAGGRRAADPGTAARNREAAARAIAAGGAGRAAGRVGRLSLRGRRAGVVVGAGLGAGHRQRLLSVGPGPPRRALAARPPAARARRRPRGAGAVRPGSAGAIDVLSARAADPGRIPGLLPDRARREAAAAARRAGAGGLRRRGARTRARRGALPRAGPGAGDRRLPGDGHPVAHQHRRPPRAPRVAADRDAGGAGRRHAVARGATAHRRARRDRRGGDLGARHPVRRRARLSSLVQRARRAATRTRPHRQRPRLGTGPLAPRARARATAASTGSSSPTSARPRSAGTPSPT